MADRYDLIIIGAGSAGLIAAGLAPRLEARVALVEKGRVGGDCTWTGCVPSKALIKAAGIAHDLRTAGDYGFTPHSPETDMSRVREYVRRTINEIYQHETPERLGADGINVIEGTARFLDPRTLQVGERSLTASKFIIATGAGPVIPPITGLEEIPYLTYEEIFDNDRLPEHLLIVGAGPIGVEIAQAYRRLGARVTLIDLGLLPAEEPEAAEVIGKVFEREGIRFVRGLVTAALNRGDRIVLRMGEQEITGDLLLIATGRKPSLQGLNLEKAGVAFTDEGIPVDKYLSTNIRHIYAAGDCVAGNLQFTHLAGWQGFQAARNALLPFNARVLGKPVPRATFTDPEVAQVGQTEAEARERHGESVHVAFRPMDRTDRAVTDNATNGFIKVVHEKNGRILGATVVAPRASEVITEFAMALERRLKLIDLANVIHVYPTYSMASMQVASDATLDGLLEGRLGPVIRWVSRMVR